MALGNAATPVTMSGTSAPNTSNVGPTPPPLPNTSDGGGWSIDPASAGKLGLGPNGQAPGTPGGPPLPGPAPAPSVNQSQSLLDLLRAFYGPQFGQADATYNNQLGGLNARGGYYNQADQYANQDYGQGLARLGIQRNINGIDQNYYLGNIGIENQLMGNHQRMFDNINQNQQFNLGNIQQALGNQVGTINLQNIQQAQQAQSSKIAGGFGSAPGQQIGMNQINQSADLQRGAAHISADRQTQAANYQAAQERYTQENRVLQETMARNGMQRQYDTLQQQAKGFGVDEASLLTSLNKSLAATGLDRQLNANQILQLASDKDPQRAAVGKQFITDFLNMGQGLGINSGDLMNTANNFIPGSYG